MRMLTKLLFCESGTHTGEQCVLPLTPCLYPALLYYQRLMAAYQYAARIPAAYTSRAGRVYRPRIPAAPAAYTGRVYQPRRPRIPAAYTSRAGRVYRPRIPAAPAAYTGRVYQPSPISLQRRPGDKKITRLKET